MKKIIILCITIGTIISNQNAFGMLISTMKTKKHLIQASLTQNRNVKSKTQIYYPEIFTNIHYEHRSLQQEVIFLKQENESLKATIKKLTQQPEEQTDYIGSLADRDIYTGNMNKNH